MAAPWSRAAHMSQLLTHSQCIHVVPYYEPAPKTRPWAATSPSNSTIMVGPCQLQGPRADAGSRLPLGRGPCPQHSPSPKYPPILPPYFRTSVPSVPPHHRTSVPPVPPYFPALHGARLRASVVTQSPKYVLPWFRPFSNAPAHISTQNYYLGHFHCSPVTCTTYDCCIPSSAMVKAKCHLATK